ncbi:MAG TPA: phosphatase PAP2 family protein [Actinomycetota bacterium]
MDERLFRDLNGLAAHGHGLDPIVRIIATYGVLVFPAALVLLWLFPGHDPHRVRTAAVTGAAAALLALGVNQVLNHLVDRARPYAGHPVHLLLARSGDASFPSDHTAVAFAVAVAVWYARPRIGAVLVLLGVALGLSRVIAGVHYPGDVLGGAAVGAGAAMVLWRAARSPLGAATAATERIYDAVLQPIRRRAGTDVAG